MLTLTIIFPLIGFLLLAFSRGRWTESISATIGIGSVGLAALITVYVGVQYFNSEHHIYIVPLWTWISIDNLDISFNLFLDGLSLTILSVVTGVGFLIHVFASWYMRGEEGYSRFFAYTNLFIASMVTLVLADNLLMMYIGWEIVGLCSYLLIGFYYNDVRNGIAAMKAFIFTRVGDVFLSFALFILYNELDTLNFCKMAELAPLHFKVDNSMLWWATLMLLGSAMGKSAQLPLHTWLADAMVGPTPASALIHAATMVTAGVYLIARTHDLFLIVPEILYLVSIIGAITILIAGFTALVQTNIKQILAYSTMSQIGYMFLALGVQAWDAAIFHLITHAFFKALLFLSSGSIVLACHHEQNIFKMGGLRKSIPLIYICFLVGSAALASLPLITAGFFSKEKILLGAMANGHINLIIVGLIGLFITSLYIFRAIFIAFHGKEQIKAYARRRGVTHYLPLIILLVLSTFVGAVIIPPLQIALPLTTELEQDHILMLEVTSGLVAMIGMLIASWLWLGHRTIITNVSNSPSGRMLRNLWYNAFGFDWLYDKVLVKPFMGITRLLKSDPLDTLMRIPTNFISFASMNLLFSVNGYLRWYIASMSIGAIIVIALLVMSTYY